MSKATRGKPKAARVLTIDGGSSSIRFAVFDSSDRSKRVVSGKIDRIGFRDAVLISATTGGRSTEQRITAKDHDAAAKALIRWLDRELVESPIAAIGHRIVHGGPKYASTTRVTKGVLKELKALAGFDPEHLPSETALVRAFVDRYESVPQFLCFDTAFHATMPDVAKLIALPRRFRDMGVRRYGFHGLSYTFVMRDLLRLAGRKIANGRVVIAHLGNGASLAAVRSGKCVDTTMGFSSTSGIPMGTRVGDIDPNLPQFLKAQASMSSGEFHEMVNRQSGLLGLSGTSSDMRDLLKREGRDANAANAVAMFCYHIRKTIGAYAAAMGGIDALVFTGGIGENAPAIRSRACKELGFLEIAIDSRRNRANERTISKPGRLPVYVVHTDEESVIAGEVFSQMQKRR